MPITFPNTFADGDAIDYDRIEECFSAYRDWLNEIPVAEVEDDTLTREAVVRPFVAGWPVQGSYGEAQSRFWETFGADSGPRPPGDAWGRRADRILMRGVSALTTDPIFLTRFGRTLYLHNQWDHDVMVHCIGLAQVRAPASSLRYPNGAGVGSGPVGFLKLYRINRQTGERVVFSTGRTPMYASTAPTFNRYHGVPFHAVFFERVTGGQRVDLVLGFEDLSDGVAQVDLTELAMIVEAN